MIDKYETYMEKVKPQTFSMTVPTVKVHSYGYISLYQVLKVGQIKTYIIHDGRRDNILSIMTSDEDVIGEWERHTGEQLMTLPRYKKGA